MKGRCCGLVLVLVQAVMMGEANYISDESPFFGLVGGDVLLKCMLRPVTALNELEVRWYTSVSLVHLYSGGQDRPDAQDVAYRGRTELFHEELHRGNTSLKLKRIKALDGGTYTCSTRTNTTYLQMGMHLVVAGFGLQPWIRLEERAEQGVRVVCTSEGWFPQPEILWRDGSRQDVTSQSNTGFIEHSSGLITVHSHIDIRNDSSNRYSCFVGIGSGWTKAAHFQLSVGGDVLLECRMQPVTDLKELEVRWFTSMSLVHLYSGGQDRPDAQDEAYRGRTELFREEFHRRNASLKLTRIKVSDSGIYTCSTRTNTSHMQKKLYLDVEVCQRESVKGKLPGARFRSDVRVGAVQEGKGGSR
ncbi:butyrophilin-like protein 10 [Amblyraja radiata]|uniref:butyrophilin-like protein 10 n=1 Tax=Amblyraja radiata TaxID=386614 RepID=UPI0014026D41|nr:butyrophilin-like protein 10 [Amblyraja radiata]